MEWCLECHRDPTGRIRPKEAVFVMDWVASEKLLKDHGVENRSELGKKLVKDYGIEVGRSTGLRFATDE